VDADLFNEHFARYQLAARWSANRRVLDAGCGTGYGSAELARVADSVTAIDFSEEAVSYAREHFQASNLEYRMGDCLSLPDGPFDLIVAFEVIEHLGLWREFLLEAKRTLAPGGMFLVSTPNKLYYAESRGESGENPFHVHEFEYAEFRTALQQVFPHVGMLLQNHVQGVAFANPSNASFESKVDSRDVKPDESHFFLAVCGTDPLPALDGFCWIPGTANILREREHHIGLLSGEVKLKTEWLAKSKTEFDELLTKFRALNTQMEERNRWAIATWEEGERRGARIIELQQELANEQTNFAGAAAGYEAKVAELEETNRAKTEWAIETERRLTQEIRERSEELVRCVALLDQAEQTVIERTLWAQALQRDLSETAARLSALRSANWVKAGAKLNLVPEP
jgi:SAM-dependent methyltransferase